MILLFIESENVENANISKALELCLGESLIGWFPLREKNGGFVQVADVGGAGKLVRAWESLGVKVVADSQVSSVCMRAAQSITEDLTSLREQTKQIFQEKVETKTNVQSKEEKVKSALRLEPRSEKMSNETWERIREFRMMQAEEEVQQDEEYLAEMRVIIDRIKRERLEASVQDEQKEERREIEEGEEIEERVEQEQVQPPSSDPVMNISVKIKAKAKQTVTQTEGMEVHGEQDEDEENKRRKLVPIDFDKPAVTPELSGLIAKRMEQYVGMADQAFVAHIVSLVGKGVVKEVLEEQVRPILDEDTCAFVRDVLADASAF